MFFLFFFGTPFSNCKNVLPHCEERSTLNLQGDWDYPAIRAMIANYVVHMNQTPVQVDLAGISMWRVSCGGLAVWEAAMNDGHFYQELVSW